MKINFLILVLLSSAVPLEAGILNWCSRFWGYKSTLNDLQRKTASQDLKDAAAQVKKNVEPLIKQARKEANAALVGEINKPEVSDYFSRVKSNISTSGIFNTTEVSYLLKELRKRQQDVNLLTIGKMIYGTPYVIINETSSTIKYDNVPLDMNAIPEKLRRVTDVRELPLLGQCEHESGMSKYLISFSGNVTPQNRIIMRIALAERIKATKRMQNRAAGNIEEVPCTKKLVKKMLIGTEQENGTFEWQKIDNEQAQANLLELEKSNRRITFNDQLQYCRFTRWNFPEKKQ